MFGFAAGTSDSERLVADWLAMSRVEKVEEAVQELSPAELAEFRDWFAEYDWVVWDQQLERGIGAGKLDSLVEEALREDNSGKTEPL
jgi:hypothetical protein